MAKEPLPAPLQESRSGYFQYVLINLNASGAIKKRFTSGGPIKQYNKKWEAAWFQLCCFPFYIHAGFGEGTPQQDSMRGKSGPVVESCFALSLCPLCLYIKQGSIYPDGALFLFTMLREVYHVQPRQSYPYQSFASDLSWKYHS